VAADLTITFMEGVHGCSKSVTAPVAASCDPCGGTGSADKSKPGTCPTCKGSGQQTVQQGFFAIGMTCRTCNGEGTVVKNPCKSCRGSGTVRKPKTVQVVVPPGVDSGISMRIANEGDAGDQGGPAGHLFVNITVQPDPFFERDGSDIHVTVPVSLAQAVLGATITVPTVRGEVELKVPPGTQPGDKVVMRGRGVQRLSGGAAGSQYVHFKVVVPRRLSDKAEKLMREYAAEEAEVGIKDEGTAGVKTFLTATLDRIRKAIAKATGAEGSDAGVGGKKA